MTHSLALRGWTPLLAPSVRGRNFTRWVRNAFVALACFSLLLPLIHFQDATDPIKKPDAQKLSVEFPKPMSSGKSASITAPPAGQAEKSTTRYAAPRALSVSPPSFLRSPIQSLRTSWKLLGQVLTSVVAPGRANSQSGSASETKSGAPGVLGTTSVNPTITKVVTQAQSTYYKGQAVTYKITVTNPDTSPMTVDEVNDALPSTLAFGGSLFKTLVDADPTELDCNASTAPSCLVDVSTSTFSTGAFTLAAGGSRSFTINAVLIGIDKTCSTVENIAEALGSFGSVTGLVDILVCDTGLGLENWWSYGAKEARLGPQVNSNVNVSNGNLVIQHVDSTPVQAHGRLAYVLRRTYNSQESTIATLPGSIGAGWTLNIGQADELLDEGVGASSIYVPSLATVAQPLAVTLIDNDATRHVFTLKGIGTASPIDTSTLTSGPLNTLVPRVLDVATSGLKICVDVTYSPPPGVQLSLWRYIQVATNTANPCSNPAANNPVVIGYAAERPDRLRYEFSATGRLLSVVDGAGVELRYTYEFAPLGGADVGKLLTVHEPRQCTPPLASSCRAFRFTYVSSTQIEVTDPGGRKTTYTLDTATPAKLIKVINDDGYDVDYTYGSANCTGATDTQLCSLSDHDPTPEDDDYTRFTYAAASSGPPLLATLRTRTLKTTSFVYGSGTTDEVLAGEMDRYQSIDDSGRVGEKLEGDDDGNPILRDTVYTWDSTATGGTLCRVPDNKLDNNLCKLTRKSLTTPPNDEVTTYTYNSEGALLVEKKLNGSADSISTNGYRAQYFHIGGTVSTHDDQVAGSGTVTPGTRDPADADVLYYVSDRTQSLTPRGNGAGSSFGNYLTSYQPDNNILVAPNSEPSGTVCTDTGAATHNTGVVCKADGPKVDGTNRSVTRNTYDTFGQKLTMTTPKAIAEAGIGATPASYRYTYFGDSEKELSNTVSAGGWLKGVTDPTGAFVAFGYDQAGNVARTWDRNATKGLSLSAFPGTAAAPPNSYYTETLYKTGASPFAKPWRFLRSKRDQLGNLTTYTYDPSGFMTKIRPPRGNAANSSAYDIRQEHTNVDLLDQKVMPAEYANDDEIDLDYNSNELLQDSKDANGNHTKYKYDEAQRLREIEFTIGPWPTDTSLVPSDCRQSTTSDSQIPPGRILCDLEFEYDGVDNLIEIEDGNGQDTLISYDAIRREIKRLAPRNDGTFTTLRTDRVYDLDGNVTDFCPPREFTEGSGSCTSAGLFSEHNSYNDAGKLAQTVRYRNTSPSTTVTSSFGYDADGNLISQTNPNGRTTSFAFDLLDRKTSMTVPRSNAISTTTRWKYDPSGDVTALIRPGAGTVPALDEPRITAYSYDAAHRPVDTVVAADNEDASTAGVATGSANSRSRMLYDVDGHVVARFEPRAFAASTTTPDAAFMVRTDYDVDGRATDQYVPRFSASGDSSDTGLSTTQGSQCGTSIRPTTISGIPAYPTGAGVCKSTVTYDPGDRVIRLRMPTSNGTDNRYVDYTYNDNNTVATVNSPSPETAGARVTDQTFIYDAEKRAVQVTDSLSHVKTTAYTSDGLVKTETGQPNGTITHVTSRAYDAGGNQISETDPSGNVSHKNYFSDGVVKEVIDGGGNTTAYGYDAKGNPTSVKSPSAIAADATNPSGTPTLNTFTFDDLLATSTVPVSGDGLTRRRTTYGYDLAGRKTSQRSDLVTSVGTLLSPGRSQSFSYFKNDRVSSEAGSEGAAGRTKTYQYDPAGNRTSIFEADTLGGGSSSSLAATYYLDGLVRSVTTGDNHLNRYSYNGLGERVARSDKTCPTCTEKVTRYDHGDAELPSSMTTDYSTGTTSFTYDAGGKPKVMTHANGATQTYTFNADDTLQKLDISASAGLSTFTYAYDNNHRITSQAFSGPGAGGATPVTATFTYGYDAAGRLTSFNDGTAKTITWDHNSNRLTFGTKSWTYNADDSIKAETVSGATRNYTEDAIGRVTSDGCANFSYDVFDRRISVAPQSAAGCPTFAPGTYAYDALDREKTDPAQSSPDFYDGLEPTTISEGGGTQYVLGPDEMPLQTLASSSTQFLSEDGHSNISVLTSTTGAIACTARFDPFGEPISPGSDPPCNTGTSTNEVYYRGARRDQTTGSYQFGSRVYDPRKGGFLTPDTYRAEDQQKDLSVAVDPLTRNTYSYVNGDPINLVDPDGHRAMLDGGAGGWSGTAEELERAIAQQRANLTNAYLGKTKRKVKLRCGINLRCLAKKNAQLRLRPINAPPKGTKETDDGVPDTIGVCGLPGSGDSPKSQITTRCIFEGIVRFGLVTLRAPFELNPFDEAGSKETRDSLLRDGGRQGGGGAARRTVSRIGEDERLIKEAQRAGRSHQRSLDHLANELRRGNLNPGIGTKRVFGDVYEARAQDGARVYFRQTRQELEILGKSSKANQGRVIGLLEDLYG